MSIDNVTHIKVFPGIGTARVGNSPDFFIGPENFGVVPNPGPGLLPDKSYKDANGLIKPQAARFRVYGYDVNDNVVMEITNDSASGIELSWDVHMRNLKAANYAFQGKFGFDPAQFRNPGVQVNQADPASTDPNSRTQLIIDPGSKTISGNSKSGTEAVQLDGGTIFDGIGEAEVPASLLEKGKAGNTKVIYNSKEVSLGRLETDADGRLIVVGGKGDSGCLTEPPIIIQKGAAVIDGENKPNPNPTSNGNSYFNNPGWYDDTSGGSINATVTVGGRVLKTDNIPTQRGWVAVSPPKYVPSMNNVVSLLDLQLDLFPDQDPVSGTLNFAILDETGLPNIAKNDGAKTLSFAPIPGITQKGVSAPSVANFMNIQFVAYTTSTGNYLAYLEKGQPWKGMNIGTTISSHSPSIFVSNGVLIYAITDSSGSIYFSSSSDGKTFSDFTVNGSGGGVQSPKSAYAPSFAAYNGLLYIAITESDGTLSLGIQDKKNENTFTYHQVAPSGTSSLAPSICSFFGQLYYTYVGSNNQCQIASYNNFTDPSATPTFDFTKITLSQTSTIAPAISASHGKLNYVTINSDSQVYIGIGSPGFKSLSFAQYGEVATTHAGALANFSAIEFYRDIFPILRTVTDYAWVNDPAFTGHAPGSSGDFLRGNSLTGYSNPNFANNIWRRTVFQAIRPAETLTPLVPPPPAAIPESSVPSDTNQTGRLMPHLYGEGGSNTENNFNKTTFPNQWLSLTPHQLWKFQEWVNGNFTAGTPNVAPTPFENLSLEEQTKMLNFSALEPTVGGGFHPGIELTYNLKFAGYFAGPFRFSDDIKDTDQNVIGKITPGSVAGYMSIPWQGDFWSCNISWWAAMRPDIVVTARGTAPDIKLSKLPWFRGEAVGIPKDADSIDGYEGGYEHMARYWSYFGFVVPNGNTDTGMIVMDESERNPCLDDASSPCVPVNPDAPEASIQLGIAQQESNSSPSLPETFYTNTVNVLIPASGNIVLANTSLGTGHIFVDDKCIIKIGSTIIYSHDYSNGDSGRITPTAPVNISENLAAYRGKDVIMTIEYIDLYPGKKSASDYFICFPDVQLGAAQAESNSSPSLPETFYTNTINVAFPASGSIILAGTKDGTGNIFVDDKCEIIIDNSTVYSHDFSNGDSGAITPTPPVDLSSNLSNYLGKNISITINYIDLYPGKKSGSEFWLCFPNNGAGGAVRDAVEEVKATPAVETQKNEIKDPVPKKVVETSTAKVAEPVSQPQTEELPNSFLGKIIHHVKKLFGV